MGWLTERNWLVLQNIWHYKQGFASPGVVITKEFDVKVSIEELIGTAACLML